MAAMTHSTYRPQLTDAALEAAKAVTAIDESGQAREGYIAAERALTIYLNKREIVTLMTLGTNPELLVLGWLKNQRLVHDLNEVQSLQVDWETSLIFPFVVRFQILSMLTDSSVRRVTRKRLPIKKEMGKVPKSMPLDVLSRIFSCS